MSISDFEQSLWELALLINPTHLANITTTKLNSYYQDTILDMRKVVLVQNLFNDIYNNWTDHQIRYQQNRRRQIENGEITEQQLLEEEMCEENESELEYISDEDGQETDEERYDSIEFSNKENSVENDNKENVNNNISNGNVIITNDNTVIQLPVRRSSVSHKTNGKPIKPAAADNQPTVDNKNEPNTVTTSIKDTVTEKNNSKVDVKTNNNTKEMSKKSSKNTIENIVKEQKVVEPKENVKQITLDFSSKDAANSKNENKVVEDVAEETESKKSKKEHSRRKKIEREPRKDSLKANVKLSDEKCNEVLKELQKSGVITNDKIGNEEKLYKKSDSAVSLDEKTEDSVNTMNASNGSFVIRSFNIPSQQSSSEQNALSEESSISKSLPVQREPIPVRKSSSFKKVKPTYRLSDKDVSIKNKYKLNKEEPKKESSSKSKQPSDQPKVHLRPKKISEPPAMQRRSMDELLFQFADVMDVVSLIPHIVGDDDLLGNDLTFNSSDLNSKVQTKDSNGNIVEEKPRRRPSRAPTPPPTVVSNGKEYEIYSIPSERHQKYIKKKEEMEKSNKRRSSLKFEYHEFEELKRQQELAGYDVSGDVPVTDRKAREAKEREAKEREAKQAKQAREAKEREAKQAKQAREAREARETKEGKESSSKGSPQSYYKRNSYASSSGRNSPTTSSPSMSYTSSSAGSCGSTMKMDVLSGCMLSSSNSSSSNSHSSSKSSGKRTSRFFSLTKSKSKSSKDKEKDKSANKENLSTNNINGKSYLVRRKSSEKSSNSSIRSHQRYKIGGSQDSSSPSQSQSSSSSIKKSYSSTTLSKYDLPHMSSLSSSSESTSRRYANGERSKTTPLPTSKSSPGLLDINLSSSSSSSSSKQNSKSSTSEIDKFFDNVFRIDWSL